MQFPKSWMRNPSTFDKGSDERASSYKYTTKSWHSSFEWVPVLLRRRLRAWDVEEAVFEECPIDELCDSPFLDKLIEMLAPTILYIISHRGRVIRRIEVVCRFFPLGTFKMASTRCLFVVLD